MVAKMVHCSAGSTVVRSAGPMVCQTAGSMVVYLVVHSDNWKVGLKDVTTVEYLVVWTAFRSADCSACRSVVLRVDRSVCSLARTMVAPKVRTTADRSAHCLADYLVDL